MSDEVKSAAERLRSFQRGENVARIYESSDKALSYTELLDRDFQVLADAYLSEHPADDDEPVTEDWLVSVGFIDARYKGTGNYYDLPGSPLDFACPYRELRLYNNRLPHVQTRGDVRRLCSALGITLQEPADATV